MPKKKVMVVEGVATIQKIFYENGFDIVGENYNNPDFLVFTGGPDVSPSFYGERALPHTYINYRRDKKDKYYFDKFPKAKKIGICRGAQFLNVMNGGALWQHVNNHAKGDHEAIDLLLTKNPVIVTSTHHQMMRPAPHGDVLAIAMESTMYLSADDKLPKPEYDTEVVWYNDTETLCFQPHPEYLNTKGENKNECKQYFFDLINYLYK